MGCEHYKYYPYQKIETLVLMKVAQKVDWYSLVSGVKTNLVELKRKQASLSAKLTDAEKRASRYAGLFEVADGAAVELAQERYLSILSEQTDLKNELAAVDDEISFHTMPDADAIKSKIDHAIVRLRTVTDPHELFELRATINNALRDSVKLYFGGHPNNEVAISYSIQGEKPVSLIYGDNEFKLATSISAIDETTRMIGTLEEHQRINNENIIAITSKIEELEKAV